MSLFRPSTWFSSFRRDDHGYSTPVNDDRNALEDDGRPWSPALRSTDQDIIGARPYVEARVKDLAQVDGFFSGAIDTACTMAIGRGPRLQSSPVWQSIPGATEDWAKDFADTIEREWRLYINSPDNLVDAGRKQSFYSLIWQSYRTFLVTGEILAIPKFDKASLKASTCIMLVDPARMETPTTSHDQTIKSGIKVGDNGQPLAYYIYNANPREKRWTKLERDWAEVKPYGKTGRKLCLHHFDAVNAEQTRGISPLAAALDSAKRQSDLSDTTLRAANLQASYALSIKSELSNDEVVAMMGGNPNGAVTGTGGTSGGMGSGNAAVKSRMMRDSSYYSSRNTGLQGMIRHPNRGSVKALQMLPNQELELHTSNISPEYTGLARTSAMQAARGVGLHLETFSGDYSELSYSGGSISIALQKASSEAMATRVLAPFIRDIFVLWLEEFLMKNPELLPAEADFWTYKDAIANCQIKLGLPLSPDRLKDSKADEVLLENRVITLAEAADARGFDWQENLLQQKREQDMIDNLQLRSLKSNIQEVADELPDAGTQEAAE